MFSVISGISILGLIVVQCLLLLSCNIQGCRQELTIGKFHCLKEILSLAEISTKHKYLRLILNVHSPKKPAGFNNEPAEFFLSYISGHCQGRAARVSLASLAWTQLSQLEIISPGTLNYAGLVCRRRDRTNNSLLVIHVGDQTVLLITLKC